MRITIQRSGGFAGLRPPPVTVDTAQLPPDQSAALQEAVKRVDLTASQEPSAPQRGADRFQYQVTIEDAGQTRSLTFNEGTPSPLKAIVDQVTAGA